VNPTPPSAARERRLATVLFADLSGFTQIVKRDPDLAATLVPECLESLAQAARAFGGAVEQVLGDELYIVFGAHLTMEDAAREAVNAAIEIRNRVEELNQRHRPDPPFGVHSGIETGVLIASEDRSSLPRDFAMLGETVILAKRLADKAPTGAIWVGEGTHRHLRDAFEFAPVAGLEVQGFDRLVTAQALQTRVVRRHRTRGRQVDAELVGRAAELARLRAAIDGLREGRGAICALVGEAGLGKTRLTAELARSATPDAVTWLEARSLSIGGQLSFHPFSDLLRSWCRVADEDDEASSLAKLEAATRETLGERADEALPYFASVMGLPLPPALRERVEGVPAEAMEKLILGSMKLLFARLAAERPLVLAFEDLHWADRSSIRLLEALLHLVDEAPVLFLLVTRPGYPETSGALLDGVRAEHAERFGEIELEPLDATTCRQLVRNVFSGAAVPIELRQRIEQQAAGNPFYVEEVVRALLDEGAVEVVDGGLRATEKIHAVRVPGTVQEVIAARIDRLAAPRKRALQIASVVGRSFAQSVIADVAKDDADLEDGLGALVDAQLLERRERPSGREYVFKHPLVQEVAYESILRPRRAELHRAVAEAIEGRLSPSAPGYHGMLAYHYGQAGDLEEAEAHLFEAGDAAARLAASDEAIHFFEEASRLYLLLHKGGGEPRKRAELERQIGLAHFNRGRLGAADAHWNVALEILGQKPAERPRERLARFARTLGFVLAQLYLPGRGRARPEATPEMREAIRIMFDRARAQVTASPSRFVFDSMDTLRTLHRVDPRSVEQSGGMYAGAIGIFSWGGISFRLGERFIALAEPLVSEDDKRELLLFQLMRFLHYLLAGDWGARWEIDDALLEEGISLGQLWDVSTYLGISAEQRLLRGDFRGAAERIERVAKIAEFYQYELAASNRDGCVAFLCLEQRQLDEGLAAAETYLAEHSEDALNLLALATLSCLHVLRDDLAAAEAALARADAIAARTRVMAPFHRSAWLRARLALEVARAEEAARAGSGLRARVRAARRTRRRAVRAASRVAARRPEIWRLAGHLEWAAGRRARAKRFWSRAIAEASAIGMRPERARAQLEAAARLRAAGGGTLDGRDAAALAAEAEAELRALGLDLDVERAARAARA
jgi:class 3 adenylate cyclase